MSSDAEMQAELQPVSETAVNSLLSRLRYNQMLLEDADWVQIYGSSAEFESHATLVRYNQKLVQGTQKIAIAASTMIVAQSQFVNY